MLRDGADRVALRLDGTLAGEPLGRTRRFDLFDWGDGVLTLRSADTGRYLSLKGDASLAADQDAAQRAGTSTRPSAWSPRRLRVAAQRPHRPVRRRRSRRRHGDRHRRDAGGRRALAPASWCATASRRRWPPPRRADTAVVVLGNDPLINGRETQDRAGIALAAEPRTRCCARSRDARPDTVLVVMSSYPYALDWADEHLPAVVWTSHGGQETGTRAGRRAARRGRARSGGCRRPGTAATTSCPHPLDYDIIKAGWTYQYHRTDAAVPVRPRSLLHRLRLPRPRSCPPTAPPPRTARSTSR